MRTPKTSSKAVVVHRINHDPPPLRIPFSCCLSGTNASPPSTQQYTEKATVPNRPFATCCVFNSSKFQDLPESPILLQCFICSATNRKIELSTNFRVEKNVDNSKLNISMLRYRFGLVCSIDICKKKNYVVKYSTESVILFQEIVAPYIISSY